MRIEFKPIVKSIKTRASRACKRSKSNDDWLPSDQQPLVKLCKVSRIREGSKRASSIKQDIEDHQPLANLTRSRKEHDEFDEQETSDAFPLKSEVEDTDQLIKTESPQPEEENQSDSDEPRDDLDDDFQNESDSSENHINEKPNVRSKKLLKAKRAEVELFEDGHQYAGFPKEVVRGHKTLFRHGELKDLFSR